MGSIILDISEQKDKDLARVSYQNKKGLLEIPANSKKEVIVSMQPYRENSWSQGKPVTGVILFEQQNNSINKCGNLNNDNIIASYIITIGNVTLEELSQTCDDGICAGNETIYCPSDCETCTDTDLGIDFYTKGVVESVEEGRAKDNCAWENPGIKTTNKNALNEWYCKDGKRAKYKYNCPIGCQDSACIK